MEIVTTILVLAIIGAGGWFAYWGIQRTLNDNAGANRSQRRKTKARRR